MKVDLITIFPGIVLDTHKWDWGKEVDDPCALDDIVFSNSRIISLMKLRAKPSIIGKRFAKYVDRVHDKMLDSAGRKLANYTIVLDRAIDIESFEAPTPDSQQLVTYFAYKQHIDHWISVDFIKVICFPRRGHHILINNRDEQWTEDYLFLLPVEQHHKGTLRIRRNSEKLLVDSLATLATTDEKKYRRLLNAIATFNESCRINQFSPNSGIVLIVSALESLLGLPRGSKRANFSYAIKMLWGFDERIGDWANQLYSLRGQIVHGDVIENEHLMASKDRHYSHFKIARDLFHDCLLSILDSYGSLQVSQSHRLEVIRRLRAQVISNKEKVENILTERASYMYQAFANDTKKYGQFVRSIEDLTPMDYSARDLVKELLHLVFCVAEDWIKEEKSQSAKTKSQSIQQADEIVNQTFDKIIQIFGEIRSTEWTATGRLSAYDRLGQLQDQTRQLGGLVVHEPNEVDFILPEFLSRCLTAISGTY